MNKKIRDLNDFEWQKCFRVYVQDENANVLSPRLSVLDDNYVYGGEFYGVEQNLVMTPLTERYFLSVWQACKILKGTLICGRPNSGKTLTGKGLAQYLGRFISVLYCTNQTDHFSISNLLQGLAQEGSWGLFDELQNLNDLCLSWFNEYSVGILQALRKKAVTAQLADGKEITLNPNFSFLVTTNPYKDYGYTIPSQFKSMFRIIALIEPDPEIIIRTRCIQYGVKAPNILATRLKQLFNLCQGSLMSLQSKYQLTIDSFTRVIQMIYDKNRETSDSRPTSFANNQSASKYGAAKIESKFILKLVWCIFS
jgi:hypothetical protein